MKRLTVFLAMLFAAVSAWGQSVKVEGTVLDNEGYPLPQAAVFVKGGTTGVVTEAGTSRGHRGRSSICI